MKVPAYNQVYVDVGDGPTVVLLHGLFGKLGMWRETISLLKNYARVVVPRLPLFELPTDRANIINLANLLHEFIEWHKLRDVSLVGHGIGGQVALTYAHDYPHNVDRIVLSGCAGLFDSGDFQAATSQEASDYQFVDQQVRAAFFRSDEAPAELVDDIYATMQSETRRQNIDSIIESSRRNSVEFFLNKLDHRVMLLWGLEDKITPPEVALHFHDYLQNSEVRFIEKCGHVPMVEQPETFARYLKEFVSR